MSLKRSRLDEALMPTYDIEDREKVELKLGDSKDGDNVEGEEIQLTRKKRAVRKQITEADIAGPDGIQRIYDVFPRLCSFHGRGNEARDVKMLMRTYREWSFQLFPTFAFEDVVSKTNKFGGRSAVRLKLDELRLQECQRYMKDILGVSYQPSYFQEDSDKETSPHNTTAEEISPFRDSDESPQQKAASSERRAQSGGSGGSAAIQGLNDDDLLAMMDQIESGGLVPSPVPVPIVGSVDCAEDGTSTSAGSGTTLRRRESLSEVNAVAKVEEWPVEGGEGVAEKGDKDESDGPLLVDKERGMDQEGEEGRSLVVEDDMEELEWEG